MVTGNLLAKGELAQIFGEAIFASQQPRSTAMHAGDAAKAAVLATSIRRALRNGGAVGLVAAVKSHFMTANF
jgi:hypothetical protein